MEGRISEIVEALIEVSQGDYSVQIKLSDKNDELDALAAGFNMMIEDICQQREELQNAYHELAEKTAQLFQTDKMAALGQLAGGLANEINNPINAILDHSRNIAKRIKENDPLYTSINSIQREAASCKKLVDDLLLFSGTGKSYPEPMDLNETIEEAMTLVEAQSKTGNIEIVAEYGSGLPLVTAKKNQIQQVIVNICTNAIDAMPEGGRMTLKTRTADRGVEFEISDTGHGIPEEVKKRIFEPFFTTKEPGKGTGLGLSLCYKIIQKHRGNIKVKSVAGEGTTFTVRLPVIE